MATAPVEDLVVGAAGELLRQHGERPGEGPQRHRGGHHAGVEAEVQRAGGVEVDADARCGEQAAQHQHGHAGAEHQQPGNEGRAVEHGDVVRHHRLAAAEEGRQRHQCRPGAAQAQCQPAPAGAPRRAVQAPQHAGQRDEPHQHRQVHVHHQRDAEEVGDREQTVQPRRARQHQQHREQARADQRQQAQPQPAAGERAACVGGHGQRVVVQRGGAGRPRGGACRGGSQSVHCNVIFWVAVSKSITRIWAGASVTVSSRTWLKPVLRASSFRRTVTRWAPAGSATRW